jgi:hypothetical protein
VVTLCAIRCPMGVTPWIARAWLPYLLIGILWVIFGAVVLGDPQGVGAIFIGVACVGLGSCGVLWRLRHGCGLLRELPSQSRTCR